MAAMRLKKDFREFIESLNSSGVRYVITGAYALAFHGAPRYTGDIDFLVEPSPENAERVIQALRAFGFQSPQLSADDFVREERVVQLGVPPARIDILTSISGIDFKAAYEGRVEAVIDGVRMVFLGRSELIKNKRAVGRPKDLADVDALEANPTDRS